MTANTPSPECQRFVIDRIVFEYADPHEGFRPPPEADDSARPGEPRVRDARAIAGGSVLVVSVVPDSSGRDCLHLEIVTAAPGGQDRTHLNPPGAGFALAARHEGDWPDDDDDLADYAAGGPASAPAHLSHREWARHEAWGSDDVAVDEPSRRAIWRYRGLQALRAAIATRGRWAWAGLGTTLAVLGTTTLLSSPPAPNSTPASVTPTSTATADTRPTSWEQERSTTQVQGNPLNPKRPAVDCEELVDPEIEDHPD